MTAIADKNMRKHEKDTQSITSILASKARALAQHPRTATKHPMLKKIIAEAVINVPQGTRIPGIRDLALALNSSLVTTQRAVTELINDGILYSKARSGIFVATGSSGQSLATTGALDSKMQSPFHCQFHFGTDSEAPYQREFWMRLAAGFQKRYPNTEAVLHFEADSSDRSKPLDVYERSAWSRYWVADRDDILDLGEFAGDDLPMEKASAGLLPLYHRTYFLFFNPEFLSRHGLPIPQYRTFADQTEYLQQVAPMLEKLGLNEKPFSIQEPVTLLGGHIATFFSLLKHENNGGSVSEPLANAFDKLVSFCRLSRRARNGHADWQMARSEFLKGKYPFFFGYSVDMWEFSSLNLPFEPAAYPTLCTDDTLFLWPMQGVVGRHSQHPVESVRFLSYLLGEEAQAAFTSTGNFAANPKVSSLPKMEADHQWIQDTLRQSHPFELTNAEDYYLVINILNVELGRALYEKSQSKTVLRRAVQLGQSYLRHRTQRRSLVSPA